MSDRFRKSASQAGLFVLALVWLAISVAFLRKAGFEHGRGLGGAALFLMFIAPGVAVMAGSALIDRVKNGPRPRQPGRHARSFDVGRSFVLLAEYDHASQAVRRFWSFNILAGIAIVALMALVAFSVISVSGFILILLAGGVALVDWVCLQRMPKNATTGLSDGLPADRGLRDNRANG